MKTNLSVLSRLSDSAVTSKRAALEQKRLADKVADARKALKKKLQDTETDEALLEELKAAATELPVDAVIETAIEVLSPLVEKLETALTDSRKANASLRKKLACAVKSTPAVKDNSKVVAMLRKRLADALRYIAVLKKKADSKPSLMKATSATKRAFIKAIKDAETTQEIVEEATALLETIDPASVIEVVIEGLEAVAETVETPTE